MPQGEEALAAPGQRSQFVSAVVAASIPFSCAGFGILELPIRWGESSPFSSSTTGLVLAAFGVGYGVAQIPSGVLTSRLGPERLLRIAVVDCLLSWPLVLAPGWPVIGLGRLLFGFGAGLTFSAGLMVLRQRVDEGWRSAAVASFGSAWAVGNLLAAAVGGSELASGALVAVLAVAGLLMLRSEWDREDPTERSRGVPSSRDELRELSTTGVKVMLLVVPAGLTGQVALVTWGPSTASGEAEASVVAVGLLVAAAILVGNWIGNLVGRTAHANAIVAASPVATALFVVFFATAGDSKTLRLLAVFLAVTASLVNFPPGMARVFREVPAGSQPFATAVINQSGWLGSALGPIILGFAATGAEPPPPAAWIALALAVAGASVAAFTINRKGEEYAWTR